MPPDLTRLNLRSDNNLCDCCSQGQLTERIWQGLRSRKFPGDIQERALRKLRQLDASLTVDDLRNPPGNRLETLKGSRAGQWSIRINDQWRICFRWEKGEAHDVEVADYH